MAFAEIADIVRSAACRLVLLAIAVTLPAFGQHEEGMANGKPTLHIGLFGNVDYLTRGEAGDADGKNGFRNGPLDVYLTSQISERWSALVELVYEQVGENLVTDLERYQLTYGYSDALQLTAGRVHNPIVRWNLAQHHGLFMQIPIDRPAIADWEDTPGLWPVHFVGVTANGQIATSLSPRYAAGIGNGRGRILDQIQTASDLNSSKAVFFSGGIAPDALPGLELHGAAYLDDIPAVSGSIDETIITLSSSYIVRGIEVRAEWSRMNHDRTTRSTDTTTGWYVLASSRLPGRLEALRPYFMIDRLNVAESDDFLEGLPDRNVWVAGVRWDIETWVALKSDYRSDRLESGGRRGSIRFQLAFAFR